MKEYVRTSCKTQRAVHLVRKPDKTSSFADLFQHLGKKWASEASSTRKRIKSNQKTEGKSTKKYEHYSKITY